MTLVQKRLLVAASISTALCVLSFLPAVARRYEPKPVRASLVTVAAVSEVQRIVLAQGEYTLTLEKHGSLWTASDGSITVPADTALVTGFLTALTEYQNMYIVSDSIKSDASSSLFSTVFLIRTDNTLYKKIDFAVQNTTFYHVFVRFDDEASMYEVKNSIATYINADLSLYTSPALFFGIQAPTAISVVDMRPNTQGDAKKSYYYTEAASGAVDFAAVSHALLSLRHGALVAPAATQAGQGETLVAIITLDDALGRRNSLSIYHCVGADGVESYLCTAALTPAPTDTAEEAAALQQFSQYRAEISSWTFLRLMELLTPVES